MAAENPHEVFCRSLRTSRESAGMSFRKLGKIAGVNIALLCEFESGKRIPVYSVMLKICDALKAPGLIPLAEQMIVWHWKHKEMGPDVDLEGGSDEER